MAGRRLAQPARSLCRFLKQVQIDGNLAGSCRSGLQDDAVDMRISRAGTAERPGKAALWDKRFLIPVPAFC
jgi:hypothetical protein